MHSRGIVRILVYPLDADSAFKIWHRLWDNNSIGGPDEYDGRCTTRHRRFRAPSRRSAVFLFLGFKAIEPELYDYGILASVSKKKIFFASFELNFPYILQNLKPTCIINLQNVYNIMSGLMGCGFFSLRSDLYFFFLLK